MSDKDLTGKELAKNLSSSKRDAAAVQRSAKSIEDSLAKAAQNMANVFKNKGSFYGGSNNNGRGGGGGGGGNMPGPSDMQNSLLRPGVGLTDFTHFAAGMASGFANFLPDVSSTIQRAGGYYNATVMGGFRGSQRISRGEVEDRTYGVLASMKGITSAGSSANVANIFANQGMVATSDTYMQNTRAVGNAARYLNMSNEKAATAIGGLGTGASSANIMRNFGVYTTDPTTGKERSMSQVFEDLAGKFTRPGANASAEDVQNSIRKGALGASIAASGLSEDQQTLFKQYMIDRAGGDKMDLSNQSAMHKLMIKNGESGNSNPLSPMMDLETSGEGAMQSAEPAYIQGIVKATFALKGLDAIAGELARVFGQVTAGLQTTLGAKTTQGLLGMTNASLNLISSGLESAMSGDPTGMSRVVAGSAAVSAGSAGLLISAGTTGLGAARGIAGDSGATAAKGVLDGGGGDSTAGNPLGSFSGVSYSTKGTTATSVLQPLEGNISVSGFNYDEKEPGGKIHKGVDYSAGTKSKVLAVAAGTVEEVYKSANGSWWENDGKTRTSYGKTGKNGNGNYVKINHGMGKNNRIVYTVYKHLSSVVVKAKDTVKAGQLIGYAGNTGDSKGAHLHYEVQEGNTIVNPKSLRGLLGNTSGSKVNVSVSSEGLASYNAVTGLYSGSTTGLSDLVDSSIGSLMTKNGISGNSTSPASKYANAGDTGSSGSGSGTVNNNVGGITVNIKDATPESAKKFAEYVQEYLNNQALTSNLGSL